MSVEDPPLLFGRLPATTGFYTLKTLNNAGAWKRVRHGTQRRAGISIDVKTLEQNLREKTLKRDINKAFVNVE